MTDWKKAACSGAIRGSPSTSQVSTRASSTPRGHSLPNRCRACNDRIAPSQDLLSRVPCEAARCVLAQTIQARLDQREQDRQHLRDAGDRHRVVCHGYKPEHTVQTRLESIPALQRQTNFIAVHPSNPFQQETSTMRILYINNDGGGFADHIEVAEGTTVGVLFAEKMRGGRPEDYLIRVNRQPVVSDHTLQEGDRVSITATTIEGAGQESQCPSRVRCGYGVVRIGTTWCTLTSSLQGDRPWRDMTGAGGGWRVGVVSG